MEKYDYSNKNFRKINGKPLFQYILEAALEAKIKINSNFDVEIVVSSDDKNIIDHANSIQADIAPFRRPIRYSKDDSLSIDAMKHALEYMEKDKKIKYDYIVKVADFYYLKSAQTMKKKIVTETNIKKVSIMKISANNFRVFLGPFKDLNLIKKAFYFITKWF